MLEENKVLHGLLLSGTNSCQLIKFNSVDHDNGILVGVKAVYLYKAKIA